MKIAEVGILDFPHKITLKRQGKHRVSLAVACFLRNRSLEYHCTPTKTISQNIPAFLDIFFSVSTLSTR